MSGTLLPSGIVSRTGTTAFIIASMLVWTAAIALTIYFAVSMCCDMKMPGGWTMSMMWMRMPGDTRITAFLDFGLMWLAMMVAMMMPAALPMFLKTGRWGKSLFFIALGYFTVWTLPVILIYPAGMILADATMQSEKLSRATPLLSGIGLLAAGVFQLTPLKITRLLHCRLPSGCICSADERQAKNFLLGCRQGGVCCVCCAGLMAAQILLGIMNMPVMIFVALAISAEKLLPRPLLIVRIIGIAIILTGAWMIGHGR